MMEFSRGNWRSNHDDLSTLRRGYNFYYNDNITRKEAYVMKLFIKKASNIIRFNDTFPYTSNRIFYHVIVSDERGREFSTRRRLGTPVPEWNEEIEICFYSYPINKTLTLMVIRENCYDDPGTSTGEVVVGRASIPVPVVLKHRKDKVIELVKLVGVEKRVEALISCQTLLITVRREDITTV
ncbi:unnamed protein product [Withania somnifera]